MIVHQMYFNFGKHTSSHDAAEAARISDLVRSYVPESWEYKRWGLEEALEFVRNHYPCFLPIFEVARDFEVIKCDFFRYLLMYHFGGIYFDLDFVPAKPMNQLFQDMDDRRLFHFPVKQHAANVILSEEWLNSMNFTGTLHNGILFSRKQKHPFWMQLLMSVYDTLCVQRRVPLSQKDVYAFTGPNLLCRMVREHVDTYTDMVVIPYFYCCPYAAVHKQTQERIICNGPGDVPSLETHNWVFFSSEVASQVNKACPNSYFVCIHLAHGSLWK